MKCPQGRAFHRLAEAGQALPEPRAQEEEHSRALRGNYRALAGAPVV